MKIKDVKKLDPLSRVVYWVNEREKIRIARAYGKPAPWTDDEILQRYKFTNVRRMDDRVSRWLAENWYTPHFNHPNMLVAATLARHFNQPHSLERITERVFRDGTPLFESIKEIMRSLKEQGMTIFSGAYMVRGIGTADKTEMVVDNVCRPLVLKPPKIDTDSMQCSVEALLPYWGLSSFMAGQIVADLRFAMSGSWLDARTWAPMGPGSKRGMNRLFERPIEKPIKEEQWNKEFASFLRTLRTRLPLTVSKRIEAIDAQSILCETDKYTRCLFGEGTPKQRYPGV